MGSSTNLRAEALSTSREATGKSAAQLLMERETRVSCGYVPRSLNGEPLGEMNWQIVGDRFLLRAEGEHYFHYRPGEGVTIERGPGANVSDELLWLNGSVYAAVASLNGFLPLHASAVVCGNHVFAFTGTSGSGKSTLVAALGKHGFPMFCDDTLILDLTDAGTILCLPGHKRLKLCPDAIELTGISPAERVSHTIDKVYAVPPAKWDGPPLPLAELILLEQDDELSIRSMSGVERLVRLEGDHQSAKIFERAQRLDRETLFILRSRLAGQIRMAAFARPFNRGRFAESVGIAADHIRTWSST